MATMYDLNDEIRALQEANLQHEKELKLLRQQMKGTNSEQKAQELADDIKSIKNTMDINNQLITAFIIENVKQDTAAKQIVAAKVIADMQVEAANRLIEATNAYRRIERDETIAADMRYRLDRGEMTLRPFLLGLNYLMGLLLSISSRAMPSCRTDSSSTSSSLETECGLEMQTTRDAQPYQPDSEKNIYASSLRHRITGGGPRGAGGT